MTMTMKEIYKRFPTEQKATEFLEDLRWGGTPTCPYCETSFFTPIEKGKRYRCNKCNSNFSVTVRTLFHRSKVDLRKWFYCIAASGTSDLSLRKLAVELELTKDTVAKTLKKIKAGYLDNLQLITELQNKLSNG